MGTGRAVVVALFAALSTPLAAQPPARWTLVPDVRIGAEDGPAALTEVRYLAVGADGTLYVGQPAEQTVRVFDPAGRPVRQVGRRGRGPGEFSRPGPMGLRGDTLWVSDFRLRRLSAFSTRDGRFLQAHTLPAWVPQGSGTPLSSAVPLADGAFVGLPESSPVRQGNGEVTAEPLLRFVPGEEQPQVMTWLSVRNATLFARLGPERVVAGPQHTSDAPLWAAAPDGAAVFVLERPAAPSADTAAFTVIRLNPDGAPAWRRTYRYAPRPFPRGYDRELVQRYLGHAPPGAVPDRAAAERGLRRALYLPPYRPPVTALVAGGDGTLWLRREEPDAGAPATWNVLDGAGRVLAAVAVPAGVDVLAADRRHVWGVQRDEMDVPYVVRFRVDGRPPRA